MISHKYKCIFIHIPKCAGTSIEQALGHHDYFVGRGMQDHRTITQIKPSPFIPEIIHDLVKIKFHGRYYRRFFTNRNNSNIKNRININKRQYNKYFKFAIVRNPWSRCHSYFRAVQRDPYLSKRFGMNEGAEFAEFMEKYGGSGALRPQTYWISDPDGKIRLDFVGRFENLHADFETVCRHLGKSDSSLPHKLNGNTSNYRSAYSDYSRELVEKLYEEEIKQFGYEF